MNYLVGYVSTLVVFGVADMAWLGAMVKRLYRPALGEILSSSVNLAPALAFYFLYPIGIVFFAVAPALKSGSVGIAALHGALFGAFSYATYNLTNYATLRHWSLAVTLVDIGWGIVLGALSAVGGMLLTARLVS